MVQLLLGGLDHKENMIQGLNSLECLDHHGMDLLVHLDPFDVTKARKIIQVETALFLAYKLVDDEVGWDVVAGYLLSH